MKKNLNKLHFMSIIFLTIILIGCNSHDIDGDKVYMVS